MINKINRMVAFIAAMVLLHLSAFAQGGQQTMAKHLIKGNSSKSFVIHQDVDFTANPQRLYDALLDSKQFTEFAGRPSEIDRAVGGTFSLFSGHIIGRNLELIPNQRIVQAWRVVDWPAGVYSIAKFEFTPQGSGTHLVFDHTGFPVELHDHLAAGWKSNYWDLLTKYLR
jgi:activator of HSP90 ATPase